MRQDIKAVALVVIGVLVAGYVMNQLYDVSIIKSASDGFDM